VGNDQKRLDLRQGEVMTERDHTRPSEDTVEEEEAEARHGHEPDRPPTPEEEEAAEEQRSDPSVAEHEKEMQERGAHQKGEGRLPD
jgi:hypothetical protein